MSKYKDISVSTIANLELDEFYPYVGIDGCPHPITAFDRYLKDLGTTNPLQYKELLDFWMEATAQVLELKLEK